MTASPNIDLSVLAPVLFVSIGAMLVLMGEVFLSRAKTVLGRPVTEAWIGSVLAANTMFWLALASYAAIDAYAAGAVEDATRITKYEVLNIIFSEIFLLNRSVIFNVT